MAMPGIPPAVSIPVATWATVGQPRRTKAATAHQNDGPPYAPLPREAEVEARADAGTRGDVWVEDNSRPRGSHICANVFSNFRRTKYQDSRRDRESTSQRGGGRQKNEILGNEILHNEIPGACRRDRRAGRGLRCFCQQPSPSRDGL